VGSVTDFLNLNFQKPGQFRVIVSYAKVFPGFSDGYIWMHQSFLTKHPSQAQTIVNALAKSYKRVNTDEAWFVQQGKIYAPTLPTSAAQAIWQAFVADKLWAEDGALKVSECQSRLDFLSKYGYVTSPAPVSKWCMSAMAQTAVAAAG
jgi:ABC-type nitrate/sulfonate/bicarbonate transport system substrate-binding protein